MKFPLNVDKEFEFTGKFLLTELEYDSVRDQIELEIDELKQQAGLDFSGSLLKFSPPIFWIGGSHDCYVLASVLILPER